MNILGGYKKDYPTVKTSTSILSFPNFEEKVYIQKIGHMVYSKYIRTCTEIAPRVANPDQDLEIKDLWNGRIPSQTSDSKKRETVDGSQAATNPPLGRPIASEP